MIVRTTGALLRALLIALAIATPALLLPQITADTAQVVVLVAMIGAAYTFVEYFSQFPTLVEFRFAPPVNRLRYFTVFAMILLLTVHLSGNALDSPIADLLLMIAQLLVRAIDFPFSPVRLVVHSMPDDAAPAIVAAVRDSAGIAYLTSLCGIIAFTLMVRFHGWPGRYGAFNVWINLPLFDPTRGGDVLTRLKREAVVNILIGLSLPFMIPALATLLAPGLAMDALAEPQTLIWMIVAWAFFPANLVMRGIALTRVAAMIDEKRRRTYSEAKAQTLQTL